MVSIVRGQIADPHLVAKARADRADDVAALHLVQSAVLGPPLARLLDLVPREPVGRPGVRVGRRPVRSRRDDREVRARRRGRAGRSRGGQGRGGARAPRHASRARPRNSAGSSDSLAGNRRGDQITGPPGVVRAPARGARRRRTARDGRHGRAMLRRPAWTKSSLSPGLKSPRTGFQRALPMVDRLPGAGGTSRGRGDPRCPRRLRRSVGKRVVVLDDLGDWRGLGTGVHLAEKGHEVTIVTAAAGRRWRPVPQRGRRAACGPNSPTAGGSMRPNAVVIELGRGRRDRPVHADRRRRAPGRRHARHRRDTRGRDSARPQS